MSPVGWKRKGDGNLFRKKGSPFGVRWKFDKRRCEKNEKKNKKGCNKGGVSILEVSASSLLSSVVLGGTHEPLGTTQTPGRPYA